MKSFLGSQLFRIYTLDDFFFFNLSMKIHVHVTTLQKNAYTYSLLDIHDKMHCVGINGVHNCIF